MSKKFWIYKAIQLIGCLCMFYICTCSFDVLINDIKNEFCFDVPVTTVQKYESNFTIIYKTTDDKIIYNKVNPTTFYNTNIGEKQVLSIVSKEQMGLESESIEFDLIMFILLGFILVVMTTLTFYDLYYKLKFKNG